MVSRFVTVSALVPERATSKPISTVGRKPSLRYDRPLSDAEIGQPIVRAASARPATSGELPVAIARNVGTKDISLIRMAPPPREMTVVVIRSRREKTQSDRTGSGAVLSINTNEVSRRTPRLKAPTLWAESQA